MTVGPDPHDGFRPFDTNSSEAWTPFMDLLEQGEVPDYGLRIVTFLTPDGRRGYKWFVAGDPTLEQMVMILERVKFLIQFRSELEDLAQAATDGDED